MKKIAKKILSLFLTSVLIIGLIPTVSVASTAPVTVDKTAQIIDLNTRTYEVALDIDGNPGEKPIDVVIVLDTSASMDSTKLTDMKTAAKDFVKKVLPQGNTQNRVSVISYGTTATVLSGFTATQGNAISAINTIGASGGTNTHAGMLLASEMLSKFGRVNTTQSVVFMSDGVPTYYLDGNKYRIRDDGTDKLKIQYKYFGSWEDFTTTNLFPYSAIGGNGSSYSTTGKDNTIAVGKALKARGVKVFTIGLIQGLDSTDIDNARATLNPSSPNNYQSQYFETTSSNTLDTIYNSIRQLVANAGTNGVVTDIVPAEFDLVPGSFKVNNVAVSSPEVTYNATSKTITWNKGNINDIDATLTYKVVAKPNYYGVLNTNESAKLVYTPVNGSSNVILNFPVPNVPVRPYATDDVFNVMANYDLSDTVATNDSNTLVMDTTGYTSALTYELVDAPYSGFTLNSNGSFTFNHNVVGPITFTYKSVLTLTGSGAFAGTYKSDLTTVTINVFPAPQHELTVQVVGSGTVTPTEGTHNYDEGTVVPLTATPAPGYEFTGWTGDIADPNSTSSVTMDADKTVTATFTLIPPVEHELTVQVVGSGTVTPTEGTHSYNEGTTVPLAATPAPGYEFAGWTGDITDSNSTSSVTMDADKTVTATFTLIPVEPTQYDLTVQVVGSGTVTPTEGTHSYNEGTTVPLTATPASGYEFAGWTGDITDSSSTSSVTMNADKTVTATFTLIPVEPTQYDLTVQVVGSGTVTPTEGTHSYNEGTVVPLTATPAPGYEFAGWTGDITDSSSTSSVTMDADKTVTATFTLIPVEPTSYTLTTNVVGQGSITVFPDNSIPYEPGSEVSLAASPASGYTFTGWTGDLSGSNLNETLVMNSNKSVTAIFTANDIPSSTETPAPTNPPAPTEPPTEPQGPQGSVVVNFVDTEGASIASSFNFTGSVGTLYQTSARTIDGYELVETPANASGSFIDGSITVDYVYSNGVTVAEEETPLGEAITPINFDSIYDNMETTEATSDEAVILDEETPLADALPQTGQASPELFYGIGSIVSALGIYLKRKNK